MNRDDEGVDKLQQELDAAETSTDQVRIAAEYALKYLGATSARAPKPSPEIAECIFDNLELTLRISRTSFPAYLSNVVSSAQSAIVSAGRGRNGGYYLSDTARDVVEKVQSRETEVPRTYTKSEEALYPVFRQWLLAQGYSAKVTASMRTLGKWSNPDITGIRVSEHFGRVDIEIATIEAKKDLADWERVFFEAVSHRRFATRAYFAFPLPESGQSKLPEDMRYYSELYNVGVLTLVMTDDDYRRYQSNDLSDLDISDPNDVVEVLSARAAPVPMSQQRRFCEALEIADLQSLLRWGDREAPSSRTCPNASPSDVALVNLRLAYEHWRQLSHGTSSFGREYDVNARQVNRKGVGFVPENSCREVLRSNSARDSFRRNYLYDGPSSFVIHAAVVRSASV